MDLRILVAAGFLAVVFCIILPILWIRTAVRFKKFRKKYTPITDIEAEVVKVTTEKNSIEKQIEELRDSYKEKKAIFNTLVAQVAIYDEDLEMIDLGFYKPHYDFDTSERYKSEIQKVKDKQKAMVQAKKAVYCTREWTVEGSVAKGRTMTNRNIRLTSRAFNNECDAIIANVRWNNAARMEVRLQKSADAIDKMNVSNAIYIADKYVSLKLEELRLTHEYHEKKQREKEEQAEIRTQMREEAKLLKEIEDAAKDEDKYQNLLDKAMKDAEKATGAQLDKMQAKLEMLRQELAEAHEKNERAKSMAEQTRQGHVYVISNIGSFGQEVYKIGMTRRLEPLDRVRELGDASVPFRFDVHALIHSDDAPALENALHKVFDEKRLNLVNTRREFFSVSLNEIEEEVRKKFPDADFAETAEAREFRESEMIRAQRIQAKAETSKVVSALPEAI